MHRVQNHLKVRVVGRLSNDVLDQNGRLLARLVRHQASLDEVLQVLPRQIVLAQEQGAEDVVELLRPSPHVLEQPRRLPHEGVKYSSSSPHHVHDFRVSFKFSRGRTRWNTSENR